MPDTCGRMPLGVVNLKRPLLVCLQLFCLSSRSSLFCRSLNRSLSRSLSRSSLTGFALFAALLASLALFRSSTLLAVTAATYHCNSSNQNNQ